MFTEFPKSRHHRHPPPLNVRYLILQHSTSQITIVQCASPQLYGLGLDTEPCKVKNDYSRSYKAQALIGMPKGRKKTS